MAKSKTESLPTQFLPAEEVLTDKDKCLTCRFWQQQDSQWGYCRRQLLPQMLPNHLTPYGPRGRFLVTHLEDWCGEYSKKSS